jgi:GTP pyrophosphokinase
MGKIRAELEDLAFKYLDPEAYQRLQAAIEKRRSGTDAFLDEVQARILERAEAETVLIVRIEGRIKRLYSIYLKMKRQKIALDQVYDLAAVRIILRPSATVTRCSE